MRKFILAGLCLLFSLNHFYAQGSFSNKKNALELNAGPNLPIGDLTGSDSGTMGLLAGIKYKRSLTEKLGLYAGAAFATVNFDASKAYTTGFSNATIDANKYINFALGGFYDIKINRLTLSPHAGVVYSSLTKGKHQFTADLLGDVSLEFDPASSLGFELGLDITFDISEQLYAGAGCKMVTVIHDDIPVKSNITTDPTDREESALIPLNLVVGFRF